MRFPTIGEIATTSVVAVNRGYTISEAIDVMCDNGHRNIVVIDEDEFYLLGVSDLLSIKMRNANFDLLLKELELSKIPTMHKDENILNTMEYLSCDIEHICATNDDGSLYGLVTHTDITSSIDPESLMNNFCLNDFLRLGKRVRWINKDLSTSVVLDDMLKNSSDSVMIVEDKKPIGIFTTKDVIRVIRKNFDLEKPISNYMSTPVETIAKQSSVKQALDFLNKKHYKRVVVVDEMGNMSGMITQKELISLAYSKWAILMKEHQEELHQINATLLNKNKQIEQIASRDPLTNLYNRYKFSKLFVSSYKMMLERENALSLVIMDIDYFKRINDTYGHNVGDEVLIYISNIILNALRDTDIVCRWGGEEFVMLLPSVNIENALSIAHKIRGLIKEQQVKHFKVTASFGVTEIKEQDDLKSVIARADSALYEAKNSGRDAVFFKA
ncbi:MAG: hypothetical protein QG559_14 [Campylobacterota bacterium]|nr:hypothetical protein [Campylobacterota bacterium]